MHRPWILTCVAVFALGVRGLAAQAEPSDPGADESIVEARPNVAAAVPDATNGGGGIFGYGSERRRVIPGLWGMHFFDRQSLELFWTKGGGIQYESWFAAAFLNSYDDLSFIAGLERDWYRGGIGGLDLGLGYRVGILTGYDGQLIALADKTPVLPFAGLHLWVQRGPIAVDAFYVYRALAFETSITY